VNFKFLTTPLPPLSSAITVSDLMAICQRTAELLSSNFRKKGGTFSPDCSHGCVDRMSLNLGGRGRSWILNKFVSELRYLVTFSNAGGSKSSDVKNDAKFRTF